MGITIKREPFLKSEKVYRIFTAVSFYAALGVLLSAAVIVPIFASETAYWVMLLYSLLFFGYCLICAVCSVLGFIAAAKTKNEVLLVQGVLHLISAILVGLNWKLFAALFFFGIRKDSVAENITGTDTDAFVQNASEQWFYLVIALLLSCILAVLATVKLSKNRK